MYIYGCMYICVCVYIYIYIYIYTNDRKSLICVFQDFFANIKNFILAGRLGARLSFYEI